MHKFSFIACFRPRFCIFIHFAFLLTSSHGRFSETTLCRVMENNFPKKRCDADGDLVKSKCSWAFSFCLLLFSSWFFLLSSCFRIRLLPLAFIQLTFQAFVSCSCVQLLFLSLRVQLSSPFVKALPVSRCFFRRCAADRGTGL